MFTEQQLKEAHSKTKTGADFPRYVQDIKKLGLLYYEYWVTNGATTYHGANGYEIKSAPRYQPMKISYEASTPKLQQIIAEHQKGLSDFPTFCHQVAEIGVEKWVVDTQKMACIYYDLQGNEMLSEPIPEADYA